MFSKPNQKMELDSSDIMFKIPFTMNIIGPSKCGNELNDVITLIQINCVSKFFLKIT